MLSSLPLTFSSSHTSESICDTSFPSHYQGRVCVATSENPLPLECGDQLEEVWIQYETWGTLSPTKDNVVLICHALTGDAHVCQREPDAPEGWWGTWQDGTIGPGGVIDTQRWFVVCSNVLGSCYGSTGPTSVNTRTGEVYQMNFPVITIPDMVRCQRRLLRMLGLTHIACVMGASLGGCQTLQWATHDPLETPENNAVFSIEKLVVIASGARLSPMALGLNAVGRQAVQLDPAWQGGFYPIGEGPESGLSIARQLGHLSFLCPLSLERKTGRRFQNPFQAKPNYHFGIEFALESYLAHQGRKFTQRFDANSYLYLTRAIDYFDVEDDLRLIHQTPNLHSLHVLSYDSDWLFPPEESHHLAANVLHSLPEHAKLQVRHQTLHSSIGHDAFLLEREGLHQFLRDCFE
ncbi:MAG: homoserine O-acetyltransferase [Vampirovibrionales bacterium]